MNVYLFASLSLVMVKLRGRGYPMLLAVTSIEDDHKGRGVVTFKRHEVAVAEFQRDQVAGWVRWPEEATR